MGEAPAVEEKEQKTGKEADSKSNDVIGHLITKDLDPRKAELLRQAQQRVMEKRKALGSSSGAEASANSTASPAGAAAGGGAKPTWQQKLDAALARRRADAATKSEAPAGSGDMDQKISDQIDSRIKSL